MRPDSLKGGRGSAFVTAGRIGINSGSVFKKRSRGWVVRGSGVWTPPVQLKGLPLASLNGEQVLVSCRTPFLGWLRESRLDCSLRETKGGAWRYPLAERPRLLVGVANCPGLSSSHGSTPSARASRSMVANRTPGRRWASIS